MNGSAALCRVQYTSDLLRCGISLYRELSTPQVAGSVFAALASTDGVRKRPCVSNNRFCELQPMSAVALLHLGLVNQLENDQLGFPFNSFLCKICFCSTTRKSFLTASSHFPPILSFSGDISWKCKNHPSLTNNIKNWWLCFSWASKKKTLFLFNATSEFYSCRCTSKAPYISVTF